MILQSNTITDLERSLLHQLLELFTPYRAFTLTRLQLHEVAGIVGRVVLVRSGAMVKQLTANDILVCIEAFTGC
ncbi:hypothetical protein D9M71_457610 [compost metagenome]